MAFGKSVAIFSITSSTFELDLTTNLVKTCNSGNNM